MAVASLIGSEFTTGKVGNIKIKIRLRLLPSSDLNRKIEVELRN